MRPFDRKDTDSIVRIYVEAFREPPWYEKWTLEQVMSSLDAALAQEKPAALVASVESVMVGFTWGYQTPFVEFPFLTGSISQNSVYLSEIAVDPKARGRRVGMALCSAFLGVSEEMLFEEVVLRTDERNPASVGLFTKAGFVSIGNLDSRYPNRPYMKRELGSGKRLLAGCVRP